ncbi:MAG: hypothetical protein QXS16_05285, partial [Pyrobaculum sp.]
ASPNPSTPATTPFLQIYNGDSLHNMSHLATALKIVEKAAPTTINIAAVDHRSPLIVKKAEEVCKKMKETSN